MPGIFLQPWSDVRRDVIIIIGKQAMDDNIERYPAEKKRMQETASPRPDGAEDDGRIDRFPAEKRQIRFDDPPELIFFDVDDEGEEAEFIRVDDLFRSEMRPGKGGSFFLTMFPRDPELIISGKMSRMIRRTLYLSACGLQCSVSKIRVRPRFIQWLTEPGETQEPETLAREFRMDMELLMNNLWGGERFWSDSCFLWSADVRIDDENIFGMIESCLDK